MSIRCMDKAPFFIRRFAQRVDDQAAADYMDFVLFEAVKVRINSVMGVMSASIVLLMIAAAHEPVGHYYCPRLC